MGTSSKEWAMPWLEKVWNTHACPKFLPVSTKQRSKSNWASLSLKAYWVRPYLLMTWIQKDEFNKNSFWKNLALINSISSKFILKKKETNEISSNIFIRHAFDFGLQPSYLKPLSKYGTT